MILRSKFVLDANLEPIDNGFVRIEGSQVAEVGTQIERSGSPAIDLGEAVLMPGLVNAHTHLELGNLQGAVLPTHDFCDWLRRLVPLMRDASTDVDGAVRRGLESSLAAGTTLLGDISRYAPTTRQVISTTRQRPAVVSFGEVLGVDTVHGESLLRQATNRRFELPDLVCAVSPHSTYTVGPEMLATCVAACESADMRWCIHAAESLAEEEFLLHATGGMREFLKSVGALDASARPTRKRPIEFLQRHGALGPRTLLAHCNYVSDADIDLLAQTNTSVAYCPRTHHAFGHPPHRLLDMTNAGVNVCLGTDSLASNPSLSILDEMRYLAANRTDLSHNTILHAATCGGAKALGFESATGTLAPGMRADLVAIPLAQHGSVDPLENILSGNGLPTFCMVAGMAICL